VAHGEIVEQAEHGDEDQRVEQRVDAVAGGALADEGAEILDSGAEVRDQGQDAEAGVQRDVDDVYRRPPAGDRAGNHGEGDEDQPEETEERIRAPHDSTSSAPTRPPAA
jgi:hypothetical protein